MYESLTKFIPSIEGTDGYGEWIIDDDHAGTAEDPRQMPFVGYSSLVIELEDAIFAFVDTHPEMGLTHYYDILERNGLAWEFDSMESADADELDSAAIMALLVGASRAERFCDGALLRFCGEGCILRWLKRLQEIDLGYRV